MSYAGFYLEDNSTATTISTQDVYVVMAGTTVAFSQNTGFTHTASPNALEYTGAGTIDVRIYFDISGKSGGSSLFLRAQLFKDTGGGYAAVTGMTSMGFAGTTSVEISFCFYTTLSNGDKIQIQVRNESNTTNLTATDAHLVVKEIT